MKIRSSFAIALLLVSITFGFSACSFSTSKTDSKSDSKSDTKTSDTKTSDSKSSGDKARVTTEEEQSFSYPDKQNPIFSFTVPKGWTVEKRDATHFAFYSPSKEVFASLNMEEGSGENTINELEQDAIGIMKRDVKDADINTKGDNGGSWRTINLGPGVKAIQAGGTGLWPQDNRKIAFQFVIFTPDQKNYGMFYINNYIGVSEKEINQTVTMLTSIKAS